MTNPRAILTGLLLSVSCHAVADETADPFILGTQTHFEQGWSINLIDRAVEMNVPALRDEIGWREVETTKGQYDFTRADEYMLPMIEKGISPFIVITDTNPLYDDDNTPHSPEGMAGLAAYVSAIFTHYGVENVQIEIGNEVNSDDFVVGPFRRDKPGYFADTVRIVKDRLREDHPKARIICSGLNSVAIGFYRDFFRRGGLQSCDAISVHPYRDNPDTLLVDMQRLTDLMREYGGEKPVYVTEFGKWFDDPEEAPDFMTKLVVQMAATGVREAYWYALLDEPWWPNMGLLEMDGATRKPAADAFEFIQTRLVPLGRPVSHTRAATAKLFEYGNAEAFVAWGYGADLQVAGEASYFDTRGRAIPAQTRLSDNPVIVMGENLSVGVIQPNLVADTKYEFNQHPWSYFARRPVIGLTPLEMMDWEWTSYRGAPDLSPLQIGDTWITTARFQGEPYHPVERFTAVKAGDYKVEGWWRASKNTESSRLIISHNRETVFELATLTAEPFTLSGITLTLEAGDTIDFELAPNGPDGSGSVTRRIQIQGPPLAD